VGSILETVDGGKKPHTLLVQVPNARCLILSTPRTASIKLSEILFCHYLIKYPRTQHLGEFLNPYHYNLFFERLSDGTKLNHQEYAPGREKMIPSIEKSGRITLGYIETNEIVDMEEETTRRVGLMKCANTSFILHHHVFTENLTKEILTVPFKHIFICKRKNIWDQILSYGIAYHTKKFRYLKDSPKVLLQPQSVEFPKSAFDTLAFRIFELEKILPLEQLQDAKTVWYEDWLTIGSPLSMLLRLDLPYVYHKETADKISVQTPYEHPKEAYYTFGAIRDLKQWFFESGLQALQARFEKRD
jgi:hypothetical protein